MEYVYTQTNHAAGTLALGSAFYVDTVLVVGDEVGGKPTGSVSVILTDPGLRMKTALVDPDTMDTDADEGSTYARALASDEQDRLFLGQPQGGPAGRGQVHIKRQVVDLTRQSADAVMPRWESAGMLEPPATMVSTVPGYGARFGVAVAASHGIAAVLAPLADGNNTIYVYNNTVGDTWDLVHTTCAFMHACTPHTSHLTPPLHHHHHHHQVATISVGGIPTTTPLHANPDYDILAEFDSQFGNRLAASEYGIVFVSAPLGIMHVFQAVDGNVSNWNETSTIALIERMEPDTTLYA